MAQNPKIPRSAAVPARAAGSMIDPMADVLQGNPTCNYGQISGEYMQTTPNAVPFAVAPGASMPISVQPGGPGTPVYPYTAAPPALPGAQVMPALPAVPVTPQLTEPLPESLTNPAFVPGYLRENIGALVRVEFLLTDHTTDRVGILQEVGASYIILGSLDGVSKLLCDLFSIRFVTIMQQVTQEGFQTAQTISASNRFQG